MSTSPTQTERPPVVVVLGHVDHGKSTLLDFIRKTNTVDKEAGGITQKVAAYEVTHKKDGHNKHITFIDTPGHAAFSAMRARGATVADIAVLVVAADDGVKEQTLEALESIKTANIPFIVAINKTDKPTADIERTQRTLLEKQVYLEKLGGDVPWVAVSAKTGAGVNELLDLILLVAEMKELKGDASRRAEGFVIEAHRDQKRGIAATLIITNGTLKNGMAVCAGRAISPVRIMENHAGRALQEASFSTPILLVGFDDLPDVGSTFHSFEKKKEAELARTSSVFKTAETTKDTGDIFYMPIIVRGDTAGSIEAIVKEASHLGDEHARVRIVQSGIGNISEGDAKAAMTGDDRATVIGFNVEADVRAIEYARQHDIKIETFDIIYKLTERLTELLKHASPKRMVEEVHGKAKVLKCFSSRKEVHVIGGSVVEGYIAKKSSVRVVRRAHIIGVGKITNLQSHKQNVERVESGSEFGAQITSDFELTQGDSIESFTPILK
ncbi:MAG TPA: translation initiation factor IF-2 [Candidatus Paceibacterota bacterium]